jgi:hypothetical protein
VEVLPGEEPAEDIVDVLEVSRGRKLERDRSFGCEDECLRGRLVRSGSGVEVCDLVTMIAGAKIAVETGCSAVS